MQRDFTRTTFRRGAFLAAAVLTSAIMPMQSAAMTRIQPLGVAAIIGPSPITEHVVLISIDGLRPDAIQRARATTMLRLMHEGSYSLRAQTIVPSKTLPAHSSMVTGVKPNIHGVLWNEDTPLLSRLFFGEEDQHLTVPTLFTLAKEAGQQTAGFFSKGKLRGLFETPGTFDHVESPFTWLPSRISCRWRNWTAEGTAYEVEEYLIENRQKPNILFVHLADPDCAGHENGWMGARYNDAVRETDKAIADILKTADWAFGRENYTVILTADHGGLGYNHGGDDPQETLIPWITWGKGVNAGLELKTQVSIIDTAPTVLWLLGLEIPNSWSGRPVEAAYCNGADC